MAARQPDWFVELAAAGGGGGSEAFRAAKQLLKQCRDESALAAPRDSIPGFEALDENTDGQLEAEQWSQFLQALEAAYGAEMLGVIADARCKKRLEAEILEAISEVRADPRACKARIEARLQHFKGKDYFPPERAGKSSVATKEGTAAVKDAVSFLAKQPVLHRMEAEPVTGLRLAGEDHIADVGAVGTVAHAGSDGSSADQRMKRYGALTGKSGECLWYGRSGAHLNGRQMVEDLVVDDGVASRGHRLGIFDVKYHVAGVAVGTHKVFGMMAAIEFATAFHEDPELVAARIRAGPPKVDHGPTSAAGGGGAGAATPKINTQWNSLGECKFCGKPIQGGGVVDVKGVGKVHAECFCCKQCQISLTGVVYQMEKGNIYCKPCCLQLFGDTCAECGKKIDGRVLNAGGKTWCSKACYEKNKKANAEGQQAAVGRPTGGAGAARGPAPAKGSTPRTTAPGVKAKAKPKAKVSMGTAQKAVHGVGMSYADF